MHHLVNINTYKNLHMHKNMYKLTQASTKLNTHMYNYSTLFLFFMLYYDTWMHIGIVQF